ncbi:hypothetical protein PCNPT3_00355 [Psychromonas sp. CNPT3]|uniref:hypothetical protein n=1 Tax=Psychromonas sp. CNPT3 TaxID=314282 RepID=UPI00006E50B6|nr:hypothetical protein [Psychromonas sp. CNPT3]AGH80013.1 hypothetical protein PCNPT3_00355 [Psychromonas sp. CNPT3]
MRLSKRGWNNVLIFGILIIFFLFNFSQKLLLKVKHNDHTLIDSQLVIIEIKTPDFSLKRNGRSWISEPSLGLSEEQLALLVHNWQNIELPSEAIVKTPNDPFVMQVYTANNAQPIIIQLIQQGDHYLLQRNNEQALLLNQQQLPLFLGQ